MHFGRKSEQLARQIERRELQLEDLSAGSYVADVQHAKVRREKPATGGESTAQEPLPPHLPREDCVLRPDSICPKCDGAMQSLGEDVPERLARVAAVFKVIRTSWHKTVCSGCGHIEQPSMPEGGD
uniref:IS66 family transposase zinc-finger binding domain-containing protein n=1 Tax=Burkholderia cepacia TaxID=292 RepID=UPI002AB73D68|nr:IS66 family transposase zinc-finger binding domain-containing protein [Burkholderia cepacia]